MNQNKLKNYVLPLVLGIDTDNNPVIIDLAKCPHLLIAGTIGSGKSECIRTIMQSLIRYSFDDVTFVICDPKIVELSQYKEFCKAERLPELKAVFDKENEDIGYTLTTPYYFLHKTNDIVVAPFFLEKIIHERNRIFKEKGVKNIDEYNELGGVERMRRIVYICDEFGYISTNKEKFYIKGTQKEVKGKYFMQYLKKCAMYGRSSGVHLIISIQCLSNKIIDENIKANFPTRIAFRMLAGADSSLFINQKGAERLKGEGDAILMNEGGLKCFKCAINL